MTENDIPNHQCKNPAAVALGRLGGSAHTRAQIDAARRNGRLGGRPPLPKTPNGKTSNPKSPVANT